jgi:cytochrome c oxidase assembly factor CtaG
MDCDLHQAASASWSISISATVTTVATVLLYFRGWRRLRRSSPEVAAGCSPSNFIGGMLVLWVVIGSPLSALDHALLTFHMVQHLLLMTIAAPLILMATPGVAFFRGVPYPVRRAARTIICSAAARRIGRSLTHPIVCWLIGTGAVLAWHVPRAHELSMRSHSWHVVQHVTFFVAGLLFWWPVVNPGSGPARLPRFSAPLYLFLATLPCDALSAFLAFCGRVVYPSHESARPMFGLTPLTDQECAGALMWFWVTIAYLLPAIVITVRMLSPSGAQWSPARSPDRS